ncbi:hypothetical protein [Fischerella thermalis]|uniref:Uncharacterized protein n=1 Tax=Fischerella thermalis JSC-11 TaxID=741277 RepID=G6FZT4_9CYAN|nr:hypothetical protein [Fischerella thermalis]PLZ84308.1 hypothetical protein CBP16_01440 [Fischerella thermalis WC217]PMB03108.1 hypothetical protein CEN49_24110 [Fischerella thermalis CCMEE 5273]PMB06696.1 hypothetical protein CI592_10295 [Fischerella thermalis CCMEE 5328]EHC08719.1 hypothetical protein FJSC11DRAFT_4383 [Fischerella thermalis JSC-11]PLZ08155.1 hypothetical protein CBP19_17620 [Fischerella thermalis WC1110]
MVQSMPKESNELNEVDKLLVQLLVILIGSWQETGFGRIEIQSEKIKHDRIAVTILGSTHYRYVISDEDLKKWWRVGKKLNKNTIE